jgi:hypothetical protein
MIVHATAFLALLLDGSVAKFISQLLKLCCNDPDGLGVWPFTPYLHDIEVHMSYIIFNNKMVCI